MPINRVEVGRIVLHQDKERPLRPIVEGSVIKNDSVLRRLEIAARLLAHDTFNQNPPTGLPEEFGVNFLIWLKGKIATNGFNGELEGLSTHYRSLRWSPP